MTALPSEDRLVEAMDVTWAPASIHRIGPWTFREGRGGGKRVSATTTTEPVSDTDITAAEAEMQAMGQPGMFMLRARNDDLDQRLDSLGYRVVDPVLIFAAPVDAIAAINPQPLQAIPSDAPLALMADIWARGGISAARLAVMARTKGPKTTILGRHVDIPAGAAFVAMDRDIAMLHALEVLPDFRRFGIGRNILGRAAIWAQDKGAKTFSLVTTGENLPAQGLFSGLGMQVVGQYHYRVK